MPEKELDVPEAELVDFFLPCVAFYTEKMNAVFSRARKRDYSSTDWWIILDQKRTGKLINYHFLSECWDQFGQFLRKKIKLFCFIEDKIQVLVDHRFKFWVFFSPSEAAEFFRRQKEKPSDFNSANIQTLPFPNLVEPIKEKVIKSLTDDKASFLQKTEKIFNILKISDVFLDPKESKQLDDYIKNNSFKLVDQEIDQLAQNLNRAGGSSPSVMKKRFQGVFKFGWRYYRVRNELETNYFKKLLSEETDEREKGLKLARKKIKDYEASLSE